MKLQCHSFKVTKENDKNLAVWKILTVTDAMNVLPTDQCLFEIGVMLPGQSKVILAVSKPCRLQLCSIGRRSASSSLLYEYAARDSNWCPPECKSHWGHKLNLLLCYLWIYYYYYCVFLYSCVLGCFPRFKWPECGSENSPQYVNICSNFLLALPHRWVNVNTTTVVPLQSGSPGGLAVLGQIYRSISHWNYYSRTSFLLFLLLTTISVGSPRTRWEDIFQRDALHF